MSQGGDKRDTERNDGKCPAEEKPSGAPPGPEGRDLEMQKKNKTQGFYRKIQKDPVLCLEGRAETLPRTLTGAAGR